VPAARGLRARPRQASSGRTPECRAANAPNPCDAAPRDVSFGLRRFDRSAKKRLDLSKPVAMIYVVDAKFFESTAGDTDRCLESSPGVVRDGARVKSPEAVMRRLLRRKVK